MPSVELNMDGRYDESLPEAELRKATLLEHATARDRAAVVLEVEAADGTKINVMTTFRFLNIITVGCRGRLTRDGLFERENEDD